MLRAVVWYAIGWIYLVFTYPLILRVKYLHKHERNQESDVFVSKITQHISRVLFYLSGSSIEITGAENIPCEGAVLFVSNHQSHMDNAIIHGFLKKQKGFVSIVELKKIPIVRTWMTYMNCVFLDREDPKQTFTCLIQSVNLLKQGHSMIIYPEGKLGTANGLEEFKKGSLKIAIKAKVPIIPVTLKGSYAVMSKDGSKIKTGKVQCIISKPILTNEITKFEENELIEKVRGVILKNLEQ